MDTMIKNRSSVVDGITIVTEDCPFDPHRYHGYQIGDLRAEMQLLQNKLDWKAPIDTVVDHYDLGLVCATIQFHHATPCKIAAHGDRTFRVCSGGYCS